MNARTEGLARSVHDRLIRHARNEGLDPTLILARYGLERFLYRLGCSEHAGRFILKGALLLVAWLGERARATRDADFLGLDDLSDDALLEVMGDVCRTDVEDDGMAFDPVSVRLAAIRAGDPYGGRRVSLEAGLGAGRIPVQIDVGMGDVVVPEAEWLQRRWIPGVGRSRSRHPRDGPRRPAAASPRHLVGPSAHSLRPLFGLASEGSPLPS